MIKTKVAFWKAGFFQANQSFLSCSVIILNLYLFFANIYLRAFNLMTTK